MEEHNADGVTMSCNVIFGVQLDRKRSNKANGLGELGVGGLASQYVVVYARFGVEGPSLTRPVGSAVASAGSISVANSQTTETCHW